jgi:hypothetical protein
MESLVKEDKKIATDKLQTVKVKRIAINQMAR